MLEQYYITSHARNRIRNNVLGASLERLADYLSDRGHTLEVLQSYMQAAEHFGYWLRKKRILPASVDAAVVEEYLQRHLPHCRCPKPAKRSVITNRAALKHLLNILQPDREIGLSRNSGDSPIETELRAFEVYLKDTCGAARTTRVQQKRYVREFLVATFRDGQVNARALEPRNLLEFMSSRARGCAVGTVQVIGSSIRKYLRFLQFKGLVSPELASAVSTPRRWSLSSIPRVLSEDQIERFLAAFNRKTAHGRRGYAMALCMLDLGMRADEVTQLYLEDIDWREGIITITRRKTRSSGVLPLSSRCGQAIADYLRHDRVDGGERRLFVSHRAPLGKPVNSMQVCMVIHHAFERAGVVRELGCSGSRILRHTAATRMHQRGATLKEVADVLGHQSIDITAIYTKVNLPVLAKVALPWPEVIS
ncbi:tyrosine-type recombinase/integrase [Candidatus Sumerlaeota bacterium]